LGIAYSPNDYIKLRANYSEGFSIPNSDQWFGDGSSYLPSPDLKPQQSKSLEFGVDASYLSFEGSLTYFISSFTNKFASLPTDILNSYGTPYERFTNLAGAKINGLELYLSYDIGEALDQEFSLKPYLNLTLLTKRENRDETAVVPIATRTLGYTPKLMANYGISFDYPAIKLSAAINASYFGTRYVQNWDDAGPPSWTAPWLNYGAFTVVNLSLKKSLIEFEDKGELSLKVNVDNVFDRDYAYTMTYLLPGRNFYVGLVYDY
jgi:vitamin B12 transporter